MKPKFIDTNIFLRYLTKDDPGKYEKCRRLFERTVRGEVSLITSDLVIAELIWTLLSYYKVPKAEVITKVGIILNTPHLKIDNQEILSEALVLYQRADLDFIDAYNAVYMSYNEVQDIYSYDEDFNEIGFVKRIEP